MTLEESCFTHKEKLLGLCCVGSRAFGSRVLHRKDGLPSIVDLDSLNATILATLMNTFRTGLGGSAHATTGVAMTLNISALIARSISWKAYTFPKVLPVPYLLLLLPSVATLGMTTVAVTRTVLMAMGGMTAVIL